LIDILKLIVVGVLNGMVSKGTLESELGFLKSNEKKKNGLFEMTLGDIGEKAFRPKALVVASLAECALSSRPLS